MQPTVQNIAGDCLVYPFTRLTAVPHLHTSFEIVALRSGRVRARLDDRTWDVAPGEILVISPGIPHCYEPSGPCEGFMLIFSQRLLEDSEWDWSEAQPAQPVVRLDALDRDVAYCLDRLIELSAPSAASEALIRAYLELMFVRLTPALRPEEPEGAVRKDLLYRAMQYMSQNLAAPLNIRGTARALGVNTSYLSHVLNERLHLGFRAYLNALRIDRARRYLRVSARPIEEIAAACGFANLRTFDRVFFERCGCTPRDFRKNAAATRREEIDHAAP